MGGGGVVTNTVTWLQAIIIPLGGGYLWLGLTPGAQGFALPASCDPLKVPGVKRGRYFSHIHSTTRGQRRTVICVICEACLQQTDISLFNPGTLKQMFACVAPSSLCSAPPRPQRRIYRPDSYEQRKKKTIVSDTQDVHVRIWTMNIDSDWWTWSGLVWRKHFLHLKPCSITTSVNQDVKWLTNDVVELVAPPAVGDLV